MLPARLQVLIPVLLPVPVRVRDPVPRLALARVRLLVPNRVLGLVCLLAPIRVLRLVPARAARRAMPRVVNLLEPVTSSALHLTKTMTEIPSMRVTTPKINGKTLVSR
jgi:hypothetical protein